MNTYPNSGKSEKLDLDGLFWKKGKVERIHSCPICKSREGHDNVLEVPSMAPPRNLLKLLRCGSCSSVFYDPPGIMDFSDFVQDRDELWRFYVEVGGGVWETIWPILVAQKTGSLLDVGCGFGFSLDFWSHLKLGDSFGVELADYGRIGAQKLGVTIYEEFLQDCKALSGRRFDVVYASEVIEHVSEPKEFAHLLANWVSDSGVLIMTTPSADFISEENTSVTLLAALSPGFHGFLLSEKAFSDVLAYAGFQYIEVRQFQERQVIWASRVPLNLNFNMDDLRYMYFNFLSKRLSIEEMDSSVWQGYAYRFLRDLVNLGEMEEASKVAQMLCKVIIREYGAETLSPEQVIPKLKKASTLKEAREAGPFFLPCLYFFLARIAHLREKNFAVAKHYYQASTEAVEACVKLGSTFYLEGISLFWPAKVSKAVLDIDTGNFAEAVNMLQQVAEEGDFLMRKNAFAKANPQFVELELPIIIENLFARNLMDEASKLWDVYKNTISRRYGDALLTEKGIEAALGNRSEVSLPFNPLYPLWLNFVYSFIQNDDKKESSLNAVLRIGNNFSTHPYCGRFIRELLSRVHHFFPQLSTRPA